MSFRINRERSLAGEAYETLAVLLADVAILLESSVDSICHPGLLIHDSPREADLFVRLYERMLDVAFSLDETMRAAWCIILSEFAGATFDWQSMKFEEQRSA